MTNFLSSSDYTRSPDTAIDIVGELVERYNLGDLSEDEIGVDILDKISLGELTDEQAECLAAMLPKTR